MYLQFTHRCTHYYNPIGPSSSVCVCVQTLQMLAHSENRDLNESRRKFSYASCIQIYCGWNRVCAVRVCVWSDFVRKWPTNNCKCNYFDHYQSHVYCWSTGSLSPLHAQFIAWPGMHYTLHTKAQTEWEICESFFSSWAIASSNYSSRMATVCVWMCFHP